MAAIWNIWHETQNISPIWSWHFKINSRQKSARQSATNMAQKWAHHSIWDSSAAFHTASAINHGHLIYPQSHQWTGSACLPAVKLGMEWHMVQSVVATVLHKHCAHVFPAIPGLSWFELDSVWLNPVPSEMDYRQQMQQSVNDIPLALAQQHRLWSMKRCCFRY